VDREDALSLLERFASADEPWRAHSLQVSATARRLAERLVERGHAVDVEQVTVLGLLHDMGRSCGHGLRHGIEGYLLARAEGREDEGRICLIHILKGHTLEQGVKLGMLTQQERQDLLKSGQEFGHLYLEEKIVCVADAMTSDPGLVSIEEKYANVRRRYGDFPHHDDNEAWAKETAAELTELLGETPYEALKRQGNDLS
jgi:hypothetical protein